MFTLSSRTSPSTLAPGVSSCMRFRQRSRVLLPQPDGPMTAVTVCAGNRSDTSRTARSCPNSAVRCAVSSRSRVLADATIALPRDPAGGQRNHEHEPHQHERGCPRQPVPLVERACRIHVDLERQRLHRLIDVQRKVQVAQRREEEGRGLAGDPGDAHEAAGHDAGHRRARHDLQRCPPARVPQRQRRLAERVRHQSYHLFRRPRQHRDHQDREATLPAKAEKWLVGFTMKVHATMPTTIDGVPFRTSAMNRTKKPSRPEPYSARYKPAPTPIGTPINAATPTMIPVPAIALATPPPDCPAGTGLLAKNAQSIDDAPFAMRLPRMSTSASAAVNDRMMMSTVITRLTRWRRNALAVTAPCFPRRPRGRRARSECARWR